MITDEDRARYFISGGSIIPGPRGESSWWIVDFDERRTFAVNVDVEDFDEELAVEYLNRYIHQLGSDVVAINITPDGELISTSSKLEDNETIFPVYVAADRYQLPEGVQTVRRSELVEKRRLDSKVDSVIPLICGPFGLSELAFKYYFSSQFWKRFWDEMQVAMRLPKHPHIVPFDRAVVDELEGKDVVVGFTTLFIPGGTVEENRSRPFKLKYFRQLLDVVDDLNLKYGLMHQDLAPRNLLIDEEADALMIFDYSFSARISTNTCFEDRDDVKGMIFTLYEIVTCDIHFRTLPFEEQSSADVEDMEEWPKHPDVQLDHPVSEYRRLLGDWVQKRRTGPKITSHKEAPESVDWPPLPGAPLVQLGYFLDAQGNRLPGHMVPSWTVRPRDAQKKGRPLLSWQRPPSTKLADGIRVLASGEVINSS